MWNTSHGDRILNQAEALLFKDIVGIVVDELFMDESPIHIGVSVFDRLTWGQQLYAIATVCRGLLREDVPCIELTSEYEATVAALYRRLEALVSDEIEVQDTSWRELILNIAKDFYEEEETPPDACDDDEETWQILIECVRDRILWDEDYDIDPDILFKGNAAKIKKQLGIASTYYSNVVPDPSDDEIDALDKEISSLIDGDKS